MLTEFCSTFMKNVCFEKNNEQVIIKDNYSSYCVIVRVSVGLKRTVVSKDKRGVYNTGLRQVSIVTNS